MEMRITMMSMGLSLMDRVITTGKEMQASWAESISWRGLAEVASTMMKIYLMIVE